MALDTRTCRHGRGAAPESLVGKRQADQHNRRFRRQHLPEPGQKLGGGVAAMAVVEDRVVAVRGLVPLQPGLVAPTCSPQVSDQLLAWQWVLASVYRAKGRERSTC